MTRNDRIRFSLSAMSVVAAGCLLAWPQPDRSGRAALRPDPTCQVQKNLGTAEFASFFDPTLAEFAPVRSEFPRDPAMVDPSNKRVSKRDVNRGPRFADLPIPDVIGGVHWKECPLEQLATAMIVNRPTLGGLELQLMMRALVTRLQENPADLRAALTAVKESSDAEIKRLLLIALGRTGVPEAGDFLIDMARKGDVGTREVAILSFAQCGVDPYAEGDPTVGEWPKYVDAHPVIPPRGRAARVLPELLETETNPRLLETLIGLLQTAQLAPRWDDGLKHDIDSKRVTDLIVSYALHSPDVGVRRAAVGALQESISTQAVTALVRILGEEKDASIRRVAASSLSGACSDEGVFRALLGAASSDSDGTVRASAASCLAPNVCAEFAREASDEGIRLYRQESSAEVRWVWVRNFGTMGEGGRAYLQEACANDADPAIRKYAVELLQRLNK